MARVAEANWSGESRSQPRCSTSTLVSAGPRARKTSSTSVAAGVASQVMTNRAGGRPGVGLDDPAGPVERRGPQVVEHLPQLGEPLRAGAVEAAGALAALG